MTNTHPARRIPIVGVLLLLGALLIAGCSSSSDSTDASASPSSSAAPLQISETWVKATDGTMTGVFGEIKNDSGSAVTIEGATSSIAGKTELHETTEVNGASQMQVKEGGFEMAAGETMTLAPGADHIMLMMLKEPVKAGDTVTIDLKLSNGETVSFEAQAKDSSAGEEPYHEDSSGSASPEMSSSMG